MRKLKRRIITSAMVLVLLLAIFFEMTRFAPRRVSLRFENVVSDTLPASFNDTTIALFSDVYSNVENLRKALAHIRDFNPNMVVFAGNLLEANTSEENLAIIQTLLTEIPDNLGKFAVLSNEDSEQSRQLLQQSGFRIIDGSRISIHNNSTETIALVGLAKDGVYNPSEYQGFELAVSHNPDIIDSLGESNINVLLAGKSLLGQVRLPLLGPVLPSPNHHEKRETVNSKLLLQSAGIGQPDTQLRFMTNPDVVIVTLKTP